MIRSELMVHKRIRIPKDIAFEVMDELGKIEDGVEFIDLTKDDLEAKKNFGSMIKRCDEMEKKISNFEKICENYNEKFVKYNTYVSFITDLNNDERNRDRRFGSTYFDLIENEIIEDEKRITELIDSYTQISENLENLIEKKSVFDKASQLLTGTVASGQRVENINRFNLNRPNQMMIDEEFGYQSDLNFIAGVIKAEDDLRMKRMIFRISKGRAIPTFFDLMTENKLIKTKVQKKIFTIFFQGGVENVLLGKLLKVCDLFNASRFNIPKREDMANQINQLQQEIYEKKTFMKQAETSIKDFFRDKIGISMGNDIQPARYELYRLYFKKERLIFYNLNKCILRGNFIDGEVWIPEEKFMNVVENLKLRSSANHSELSAFFSEPETSEVAPPTYIKTNELTGTFQLIVDTYGVPRYREVNPALFNIVTFPFLFGVMFGDIGHGLLLALFGLFLVLKSEDLKKDNSPLKPALKARYLLFFMGLSAFYCGWMYNDFLSVPLGIFGTCYVDEKTNSADTSHHLPKAHKMEGCTYPFGLDPKWYVSTNELAFMNSMKMKLSVIFGVIQMLFGICLKGLNAYYFKNPLEIVFEFIPQVIFMVILFGYMIVLIFIKWATDWSKDFSKAPSIITQLMSIFLNGGSVGPNDKKTPLWGLDDYHQQENFHFWILIIALICIPIILLPKPIILYLKQTKAVPKESVIQRESYNKFIDEDANRPEGDESHGDAHKGDHAAHHNSHGFGEMFIHQAIETIEFVLGSISNTASYLRLWALSLAHGQLSKVFFQKTLLGPIQEGDIIMIVIGFFIFANVTFGVLMCMDLMECFLHTLRLHWVEFQNKFYKADGYKFNPFCFKYIVEGED